MESYCIKFPPQIQIFKFIFYRKSQTWVKVDSIEKSLFFNEISVEYKAEKKHTEDYIEWENRRVCPISLIKVEYNFFFLLFNKRKN